MPDEFTQIPTPPPAAFQPGPQVQAQAPSASQHPGPYASPAGTYAPAGYPFAYGAYAPRKQRPAWFWPLIILGSLALIGLFFWAVIFTAMHASDSASSGTFATSQIAVIDLDGVIVDADKVDNQLRKFGDDSSVKAIILHINSPGGGAAASQEIYHEVLRVRQETHKPIVASVESVGASGAYYIASGCDKIYANDASVVGSIGVIMEWTNYGDLMRWAKLKPVVIHAGELKDAGDPSRDMTPKEAAYFQSLVDNMYAQFITDVASGRHTDFNRIAPLATGQVWTGQQSLPLGLIDKVGGFRVALIDTARQVGISGEPTILRPAAGKKGLAALLNGDADDLLPNPTKLLDRSPGFFFLWK
jgi:protease-4